MGRFLTTVPDISYGLDMPGGRLIKGLRQVAFRNQKMIAQVEDSLSQEEYEELAKQLRLVFGFSFRNVYSESYQISTPSNGFHYTGQDERKTYLLSRKYNPTTRLLLESERTYRDLLGSKVSDKDKIKLFNLLYAWTRAHELQQLYLPLEAQVILGKIVDDMTRDGAKFKAGKLVKGLGIIQTESDQFAARLLITLGRDKFASAKDELEGFSYLYRLRQRQAELLSGDTSYYLGKKAQAEAERKNSFLFEITRLYILWLFGLEHYYLKQHASSFRIETKKNNK